MPSIKQEMLHGVFWSAIEKYSGIVVSLIVSAVLARLISPEDFGTVAIVTVIINFFSIFATMGIFPAIIQRNDLTQKDLDSIFTYSILGGLCLSSLLFCLSWKIADFYNDGSLVFISQILSVNIFFASLNLVPNALMAKNKRFRQIAQRTLSLQVFSGIISIIAAHSGFGIYSLLISPIVTSIGMFLFNIHYYPCHVDFTFDLSPLKKIFSYSSYQFLFEFINYFSRNADKLIIGKYLNMGALGYYDKSYRLMMLPLQNVTSVINPVIQPVLSSSQDDKSELAKKYNKIIQCIAAISFPLAVFLFFAAYEIINIVYGDNWNPAVPVFKILTISLPLQMILSSSGAIFQTANSTDLMFFTGIRNTFVTLSGFLIAICVFNTIEAVAWSWDISLAINFILTYHTMYRKVFHIRIWSMIRKLSIPLYSALLLCFFLSVQQATFSIDNIYLSLLVKCLVAFGSMALSMRFIMHTNFSRLLYFIKS